MAKKIIDAMWDDSPIDVSTEVNFIWSISYQPFMNSLVRVLLRISIIPTERSAAF